MRPARYFFCYSAVKLPSGFPGTVDTDHSRLFMFFYVKGYVLQHILIAK